MPHSHPIRRAVLGVLLVLVLAGLLHLGLGLAFHFTWQARLAACREERAATGEFVEPEVFWAPLALAFDVLHWPVYAWANLYHDGTPFATPCTH